MKKFITLLIATCTLSAFAQVPSTWAEWRDYHGLRPATFGVAEKLMDSDGDGLSDWIEFQEGLNPTNQATDGTTHDYYRAKNGSTMGKVLTGNDSMPDWYKLRVGLATNEAVWSVDSDNDGWDNWSEMLAGTDPNDPNSYPQPTLQLQIDYTGKRAGQNTPTKLVVHAYTDEYMNGMPDAVYIKQLADSRFPKVVMLGERDCTIGYIRQGKNYFYAFLDCDGSTIEGMPADQWLTWTNNEPAGLADGHLEKGANVIGWQSNRLRFGLTDEAKSFARIGWEGSNELDKKVDFENNSGTLYSTKTIKWPRTWLHEGDLIAGKSSQFGLGWGIALPPQNSGNYRIYNMVGIDLKLFTTGKWTNSYSNPLAQPITIDPKGDAHVYVYGQRPEFRFRLAPEATEFEIEIRSGTTGASETAEYQARHLAPPRRNYGGYSDVAIWTPPFCWGDTLEGGVAMPAGDYRWRLEAYSPAHTGGSTWTDRQVFTVTKGATINAQIDQPAGQPVRVQAYDNPAFAGQPKAAAYVTVPATAELIGLQQGKRYYIKAFVDDNSGHPSGISGLGYYRTEKSLAQPFRPAAALARESNPQTVKVWVRD